MAKPKPETETPGTAIAVRGFNYTSKTGAELRVEAGEQIPAEIPADVVEALVAEGAARR